MRSGRVTSATAPEGDGGEKEGHQEVHGPPPPGAGVAHAGRQEDPEGQKSARSGDRLGFPFQQSDPDLVVVVQVDLVPLYLEIDLCGLLVVGEVLGDLEIERAIGPLFEELTHLPRELPL